MPRTTFTYEGKRYDITAKTKEELVVKKAMRLKELEEGSILYSQNTTVKKWGNEYMRTYKEPSISNTTHSYLYGFLKNYIYPQIGTMKIKDVKAVHLQRIVNQGAGKSYSFCDKLRQLLRGMFGAAVDNQMIHLDPSKNLTLPDCTEGSHRELSDKERAIFLQVASTHPYGLWALFMLYCGLRPGETARILGCHIDRKRKRLYVDGTKSKAAKRYVPIPDILLERIPEVQPYDYLFTQKTSGRPITKTSMRGMWNSITRAMNIAMGCHVFRNALVPPYPLAEDLTPYCLRHTFCTDLQDAGVPINVAKELMGHTKIETTTKYYTHFTEKSMQSAAYKMNNFYQSAIDAKINNGNHD